MGPGVYTAFGYDWCPNVLQCWIQEGGWYRFSSKIPYFPLRIADRHQIRYLVGAVHDDEKHSGLGECFCMDQFNCKRFRSLIGAGRGSSRCQPGVAKRSHLLEWWCAKYHQLWNSSMLFQLKIVMSQQCEKSFNLLVGGMRYQVHSNSSY